MTDDVKKALDAIGAMAEMVKFAYDSFCQVGFAPDAALKLASDFMAATMAGGKTDKG